MSHYVLQDEVEDLKALLDRQGYDYRDGADVDILATLTEQHGLPKAYWRFLSQLDPGDSAWRMGGRYHLVLHPADELSEWQTDTESFQIGSLNGQPLLLDLTQEDTPVMRQAPDGSRINMASSLGQFFQILRTGLEILPGLADLEDEPVEEDTGDDSFNEYNSFDDTAFGSGREDLLSAYFEELESIDPDCAEAWMLTDGDAEE